MSEIIIKNLDKSFGKKTVIKDFSYVFKDGVNFIFGKSGCGKSTLLRIIGGLEKADGGEINVVGKTAFMFQEQRLLPYATAVDNLTLFFGEEHKKRGEEILSTLGIIGDDMKKPVRDFSGGMAQRVSMARLILYVEISNPDTVLLDEPFRGLDAETKKNCSEILKNTLDGKTVIIISHDEEDTKLFDTKSVLNML